MIWRQFYRKIGRDLPRGRRRLLCRRKRKMLWRTSSMKDQRQTSPLQRLNRRYNPHHRPRSGHNRQKNHHRQRKRRRRNLRSHRHQSPHRNPNDLPNASSPPNSHPPIFPIHKTILKFPLPNPKTIPKHQTILKDQMILKFITLPTHDGASSQRTGDDSMTSPSSVDFCRKQRYLDWLCVIRCPVCTYI